MARYMMVLHFPQSVAVGSTFNLDLAYQMTKAIATELRSQGVIQTLSPGLDVVRVLHKRSFIDCVKKYYADIEETNS